MAEPWTFAGAPPSLDTAAGIVSLIEGSSFCISAASGDIDPRYPHGLFFRDSRVLSRFQLRLNGVVPETLATTVTEPFAAAFAARGTPRPGHADATLMVFRRRWIGRGLREDIEIRNLGVEPVYCQVELALDVDFADLFEVKEGRVGDAGGHTRTEVEGGILFEHRRGESDRGVRVRFTTPGAVTADGAQWEAIVPGHGSWSVGVGVAVSLEGQEVEPRFVPGEPVERATPGERLARWRASAPTVESDYRHLGAVVASGVEDLGALRMFDPEFPERTVVAAGAPWFMTLFGRDSLITAWMALLADPDLALGVLHTLARFQGKDVDARTEEEPGRILHEMRFGEAATLSLGGGSVYYGTADATPLFVVLLGELRRWGLAAEAVDALIPHAEAAMAWIEHFGDRDGDGYVEYQRTNDRGLANQGWKDSWDGIQFADGTLPRGPIALAEVQGYTYSASLAWSYFLAERGLDDEAARWRARAADLKRRFDEDFWLDEQQCFAVALDGDKRPVDSVASNQGHCLWTGIVAPEKAAAVARALLSREMFSGWGIRTLSSANAGYNPIGYHTGTVWPHDNAIIVAGLTRYGFTAEAHSVIAAVLDAAIAKGNRLPELFSGLDRADFASVVPYPTSCSPQAWAAASPLAFVRSLLRLDPWVPHGKVWLAPALLPGMEQLKVSNIPLAGGRVTISIDDGNVKVNGLPAGIELVTEPRNPLTQQQ
ncbi:MAG TPA: glycogen debranching N-terminal domain-containing protein [Acidimicrobiales bacterium]|nr:glycogen debranching N-terminal domain-containing protein [Acidimicrobiales bacterium]